MVCGASRLSRTILAGMASVTQSRAEAKPGRAGSKRTSGAGPSLTNSDLPSSSRSMVTMRRAGLTPSGSLRLAALMGAAEGWILPG